MMTRTSGEFEILAIKGLAVTTAASTGAVVAPTPDLAIIAAYGSFGATAILLPMWRDEFRGARRSAAVLVSGVLFAGLVGPAVVEYSEEPYLAALASAAAGLLAPSIVTRPGFVFSAVVAAVKEVVTVIAGRSGGDR